MGDGNVCGIVAIYSNSAGELEHKTLLAMTEALHHRGPDDYGYGFCGPSGGHLWKETIPGALPSHGVAMGHRRLSIIDRSAAGRQPFVSADGRYWMVYNGEIYNYRELRKELERLGHVFRTATDTEVLLTAYAQWGRTCFSRLNGMWAVLIWDKVERTLVACRDRLGIKPLYFSETKTKWIFASEVKALLHHPEIDVTPDMNAVNRYLQLNELPDGGKTLLNGVREVDPGCCLIVAEGRSQKFRYWSLPHCDQYLGNMQSAVEKFQELFEDAVRLRLRSDVPVGTMLSGGLDSTAVIATMNALRSRDTESLESIGPTIQAFHASFPGQPIDETEKVEELCGLLGLRVRNVRPMEEEQVEALMSDAVYHMDFPFHSSIPLVNILLMRRAKAAGITVVLNGHGSDELFAGYPATDCPIAAADEFRKLHWVGCLKQIRGMVHVHGHSWKRAAGLAAESLMPGIRILPRDPANRQYVRELFAQQVKKLPTPLIKAEDNWEGGRTGLERMLRRQVLQEILPRWLHMEDRTSMSASVEARQPFLDYRVVEFAFSLDNTLKIRAGVTKAILREAMKKALPPSIVEDKRKFFFPGPDAFWLAQPLAGSVRRSLLDRRAEISEIVRPDKLKVLVEEALSGNDRRRRLLWRLYFTERWLRDFCGTHRAGHRSG